MGWTGSRSRGPDGKLGGVGGRDQRPSFRFRGRGRRAYGPAAAGLAGVQCGGRDTGGAIPRGALGLVKRRRGP